MSRKTLAQDADRREIASRLELIQPTSSRRWGKMTPHEMLCHLSDSFRLAMGERSVTRANLRELPAPMPRWFLKWVALEVPMQWPHGVPSRPEVDPQRHGTRPAAFEADRQTVLQQLQRFTRQPRDFKFGLHPIFDNLTEDEWMRWAYLHMDHHLRQFSA
jgi:hypothetical protein